MRSLTHTLERVLILAALVVVVGYLALGVVCLFGAGR